MTGDAQQYLERLCDHLIAHHDPVTDAESVGVEPFSWGTTLCFSPRRTKMVMRELLQHHLLDIGVVEGSDGRNELRLTWNRETERWYARVQRWQRAHRHDASA